MIVGDVGIGGGDIFGRDDEWNWAGSRASAKSWFVMDTTRNRRPIFGFDSCWKQNYTVEMRLVAGIERVADSRRGLDCIGVKAARNGEDSGGLESGERGARLSGNDEQRLKTRRPPNQPFKQVVVVVPLPKTAVVSCFHPLGQRRGIFEEGVEDLKLVCGSHDDTGEFSHHAVADVSLPVPIRWACAVGNSQEMDKESTDGIYGDSSATSGSGVVATTALAQANNNWLEVAARGGAGFGSEVMVVVLAAAGFLAGDRQGDGLVSVLFGVVTFWGNICIRVLENYLKIITC
ncbi:hypothetical protein PHJA_000116100 [Phtheirospermum japonicum]|uniref:Uncharacterized protein n=1 Tax=Phtheirospermum japonicum TaxID=374723 RepID=A0A830AZN7_9LAMI|nr:hypothetical protein PHJA_000116100 [Phtheirospermum japonicum]